MEELLKKYYNIFKDGVYSKRYSNYRKMRFDDLYDLIINAYDISNDKEIERSIIYFMKFFDQQSWFDRIPGRFSLSNGEENSKIEFARVKNVPFQWFKPSKHMLKNSNFIFMDKYTDDVYCKAYLSIKPEKYISVLIRLQQFIDGLYLNHGDEELGQIKFRNFPANDAIVLRFAKEEQYQEFLAFLDVNQDIIEAFDKPNLFMPQDKHGLSLVPDNGGSYNHYVTRMLWDYFTLCRNNEKDISICEFIDFINNYDSTLDKTIEKNGDEINSIFKKIFIGKLLMQPNEDLLSYVFKDKNKVLKLKP